MARQPQTGVFGVQSVTFSNQQTKIPIAQLKVPAELNFPFEADLVDLFGGANKFVLEAEPAYFKSTVTMQFKQFDAALYKILSGATITTNVTPNTTGTLGTPEAIVTNGATNTVTDVTKGIASTAITAAVDLKVGRYIIVAMSSSTVDIYAITDLEANMGTNTMTYADNTLLVIGSPFTLSNAATTITGLGFSITSVATPVMTTGDSAYIDVMPPRVADEQIVIGMSNLYIPKVDVWCSTQEKGNGESYLIHIPNMQPSGLQLPLKEFAWAANSPKLTALYDSTANMIAQVFRCQRNYR
jgi:hypothetical protein